MNTTVSHTNSALRLALYCHYYNELPPHNWAQSQKHVFTTYTPKHPENCVFINLQFITTTETNP